MWSSHDKLINFVLHSTETMKRETERKEKVMNFVLQLG